MGIHPQDIHPKARVPLEEMLTDHCLVPHVERWVIPSAQRVPGQEPLLTGDLITALCPIQASPLICQGMVSPRDCPICGLTSVLPQVCRPAHSPQRTQDAQDHVAPPRTSVLTWCCVSTSRMKEPQPSLLVSAPCQGTVGTLLGTEGLPICVLRHRRWCTAFHTHVLNHPPCTPHCPHGHPCLHSSSHSRRQVLSSCPVHNWGNWGRNTSGNCTESHW